MSDPAQASGKIRIAVADDHPVVRDGLVAMLETQPDFEIVGSAATGTDALALVASLQPDVLLLDLEMPLLDGVDVSADSAPMGDARGQLYSPCSIPTSASSRRWRLAPSDTC